MTAARLQNDLERPTEGRMPASCSSLERRPDDAGARPRGGRHARPKADAGTGWRRTSASCAVCPRRDGPSSCEDDAGKTSAKAPVVARAYTLRTEGWMPRRGTRRDQQHHARLPRLSGLSPAWCLISRLVLLPDRDCHHHTFLSYSTPDPVPGRRWHACVETRDYV